ncbi:MAG: histidine--tRNA ligase [Candidatus Vogelbacteria bacterium]|nr:histidine--tRNA ligase [Candidatus Vogelbacteria bacterium]
MNNKNKTIPSILPGFMELLPKDQMLFNGLLDTIRQNYERFGFIPVDTPVMEKAEVLLAKAGGETEKQIYRFLKGDNDIALRFDLTVPLSRYVAEHKPDLKFPFRRYHIGKVYRGEKPQRGRFREFYQCDVDIIGNGSLEIIYDAEMPAIIYGTLSALGFKNFTVKINNRKILNGFFSSLGLESEQAANVLRIIDKLDKIGLPQVKEELTAIVNKPETVDLISEFIAIKGDNKTILDSLVKLGIKNDIFQTGVAELSQVLTYAADFGVPEENLAIDLTIARGLDYYTGTVYETNLNDYPQIGSICSGGRYDNLTEYYTDTPMPGVGVSIGLTRLFYQLREAGLIKPVGATPSQVVVIPLSPANLKSAITFTATLREAGINSETYLADVKTSKKFDYANDLGIRFAAIIGPDEEKQGTVAIKNLVTGEQNQATVAEAIELLKNKQN